jgi:hypothetical protein
MEEQTTTNGFQKKVEAVIFLAPHNPIVAFVQSGEITSKIPFRREALRPHTPRHTRRAARARLERGQGGGRFKEIPDTARFILALFY